MSYVLCLFLVKPSGLRVPGVNLNFRPQSVCKVIYVLFCLTVKANLGLKELNTFIRQAQ